MNADEIARVLDELGARLGPPGEYVFGLAVRQAYINGTFALILALITIFVGIIAVRKMVQIREPEAAAFLAFMVFVIGAIMLYEAARNLFNPEYAALSSIIGQFMR